MNRVGGSIVACLFLLLGPERALAQRLIIESATSGPAAKVIYGRVTDKSVAVFEANYPLEVSEPGSQPVAVAEQASAAQPPAPIDTAPETTIPAPKTTSQTLTSFTMSAAEIPSCMSSPRFKGFLQLATALKDKINDISIASESDSEECAGKITEKLKSILKSTQIESASGSSEGIRIELKVTQHSVAEAKQRAKEETLVPVALPHYELPELLKNTKITVAGKTIAPNPDGYFVFELEDLAEQNLKVIVPGFKLLSIPASPVSVGTAAALVKRGQGYTVRMATFNNPKLNISISETPFLAKKTTIDGGFGGGLGYGRQVPGERRGQRMVALLGIERRGFIENFGARGGIFYTRAPSTVVPQTFTLRGLGFYDWSFLDDELTLRMGGGLEIFNAQIKYPEQAPGATSPQVLIPQQISVPLVSFSMHSVLFKSVIISPVIQVTPLYVPSVGFYPAINPSLEIGAKAWKDYLVVLQLGSETHRFPSVAGETKLQLDYALITAKRGVF